MTDNFFELVKARRAIKEFDDSHVMPSEDLKKIMTAAHYAPTAFNLQHYRFVVIEDKDTRKSEEFDNACWNQTSKSAHSSALIVLCADLEAWQKNPARYWENVPEDIQDTMVGMIKNYYEGKDQIKRDEAHRSCAMAGMNIMLAATALGYDTCPMDGFDYDAMGKLINLPDDHAISFMIAVGKKSSDPFPKPTLLGRDEIVIQEKFG